jgi:hypothetical protein
MSCKWLSNTERWFARCIPEIFFYIAWCYFFSKRLWLHKLQWVTNIIGCTFLFHPYSWQVRKTKNYTCRTFVTMTGIKVGVKVLFCILNFMYKCGKVLKTRAFHHIGSVSMVQLSFYMFIYKQNILRTTSKTMSLHPSGSQKNESYRGQWSSSIMTCSSIFISLPGTYTCIFAAVPG